MYNIIYTRQAYKDAQKISKSNLQSKVLSLLDIIQDNPFEIFPPYEKLQGGMIGTYSRRINIQHRLIYEVIEHEKTIKIIRMWTHYGDN